MTLATPVNPNAATHDLVQALRREDMEAAERLFNEADPSLTPEVIRDLAEMHMRRRRWSQAAWLFDRMNPLDPALAPRHRLSRNLAALRLHRPEIYETLENLPATNLLALTPSATGELTILTRTEDGRLLSLSPGHNPLAAASEAMASLKPSNDQGLSVALCGMGDGYLLHAMSRYNPGLFLGMQQPVFLLEPDAQIVLHCLMIHDCTGAEGPIEQPRFQWFIGERWAESFQSTLLSEHFLPCPSVTACQGTAGQKVQSLVQQTSTLLLEQDAATKAEVDRYYASVTIEEVVTAFSPTPLRKPRVLLLTTRFSTVLQYSTRDAAQAFTEMGWDARVLIEPTPHHRLMQFAIRNALAGFKPDLVFQIDHLRYEHGDMFLPNLPFACWVQDHLPNLQNARAGASVTTRDFVLTDAGPLYSARHGYPLPQCIALPKLTRITESATDDQNKGDDLVFVSNASHVPERLIEKIPASISAPAGVLALAARCARRILHLYSQGGSLATYLDVCEQLRLTLAEAGVALAPQTFRDVAAWLTHPFNDALYRQQGLAWAAAVAKDLGLSLALYGKGWENHPRFATHARGPVQYGAPLEELTRRSRFNLQIVPFTCLHQRLLDGLVAGGFFLVRSHPGDTQPRELLDFLESRFGRGVNTLAEARAAVAPEDRTLFEAIAARAHAFLCADPGEDAVACVRASQAAGLLIANGDLLPRLGEVCFNDSTSLRKRVEAFLANPAARSEIASVQRAAVIDRFSYVAGLRRVVGEMHSRLAHLSR